MSQHDDCCCIECILRRAIERLTEANAKLRDERDALEAQLLGANEGARTLRESLEKYDAYAVGKQKCKEHGPHGPGAVEFKCQKPKGHDGAHGDSYFW